MKKLMIIDGSSLLFRAFFALPPLKSALGTPTNAVYGFLTMLIKLYEEINPDYIAVAFDKGRQTFRTEMYSEYNGSNEKDLELLQIWIIPNKEGYAIKKPHHPSQQK